MAVYQQLIAIHLVRRRPEGTHHHNDAEVIIFASRLARHVSLSRFVSAFRLYVLEPKVPKLSNNFSDGLQQFRYYVYKTFFELCFSVFES